MARLPNDPARVAAQRQHKKLTEEYDDLWKQKYEEIKDRLKLAAGTSSRSPMTINDLKIRFEELKRKKEELAKLYKQLKIDKKTVNSDNYDATLLTFEVSSMMDKREQIRTSLSS